VPDISKLLWPKTVAVVGASSDKHGLRGRIFETMLSHPFEGAIYPVSRSAAEVQEHKAYKSVAELPEPPDLAILIIPAEFTPDELDRCGKAGVKAAVILSSGFAEEPGETGHRMQAAIRSTAERYDMAVTGPNTEGFANIAAALVPTFSPAMDISAGPLLPTKPLGGQVSVISQSGGLGFAFFDRARGRNIAFRHIVTTGNEAFLEASDILDYVLDEGKTDVFLLLLEDVKTPEKFRRAADKALKAGKPLIVAKIGQTEAGRRAVASHTAALAGSQVAYRAIFQHHGVIEGGDFDEMIDLAAGFLACGDKLPEGKRMGICTSSGGAGVWMTDACVRAGLDVPKLDAETRAKIDVLIPSYGTSQNPIDSTAQGVHQMGYATFAQLAAESPMIDGVIVVVTARRSAFLADDQPRLMALARQTKKPVFFWTYTLPAEKSIEIVNEAGFPIFRNADGCARAMAAMADYKLMRERLLRQSRARAWKPHRAAAHSQLASSASVLCEWKARPLLATYGIDAGQLGELTHSAAEAECAARKIGKPVALKVQSAGIMHKTEVDCVAINVEAGSVGTAFDRLMANAKRRAPSDYIEGVLVQPMAPAGREVILGVNRDATWGPLLVVGLGGVLVEALSDVALAPVPLDHEAARTMLGRLKGAKLLGSCRGAMPADIDALVELMVQLSHFAADHADDIAEIDLNPVIVHGKGQGVSIVDALIVCQPRAAERSAAE
jgi:acetate---CoA ligase (ADP-forming)